MVYPSLVRIFLIISELHSSLVQVRLPSFSKKPGEIKAACSLIVRLSEVSRGPKGSKSQLSFDLPNFLN